MCVHEAALVTCVPFSRGGWRCDVFADSRRGPTTAKAACRGIGHRVHSPTTIRVDSGEPAAIISISLIARPCISVYSSSHLHFSTTYVQCPTVVLPAQQPRQGVVLAVASSAPAPPPRRKMADDHTIKIGTWDRYKVTAKHFEVRVYSHASCLCSMCSHTFSRISHR